MLVGKDAGRARQGPFDLRKQRRAGLAEAIARTGLDEGFECLAAQRTAVHLLAQFGQGFEFPMPIAGLQDGFDGGFAHALDGGQAETDGLALARRSKEDPAFVHIRPAGLRFQILALRRCIPLNFSVAAMSFVIMAQKNSTG